MRVSGRNSLTFRLTLLFASASTLVLLILGLLIGNSVERHFEEQDMGTLAGKLQLARHVLEKSPGAAATESMAVQLDSALTGHPGLVLAVFGKGREALYVNDPLDLPEALLATADKPPDHPLFKWQSSDGLSWRGIAARIPPAAPGGSAYTVAVATEISHHEHFMASFRATLWSVVVLAALLTGFLGWIAAKRGLTPLLALKREAENITAHRLHARLSTDTVPTELVVLAETLNAMLARLEDSFRRLSDFSADIAHELRTPVSNLLTQTQVTLSQVRTPDEYRNVLASNVEELERMAQMIADMLFLAKSDNDLVVPQREPLDLVEEVRGLFEFYEALAEARGVVLHCSGRGQVAGDRLMLRRALGNLLANALCHTPPGGRIVVHVDDSHAALVKLSVENSGETIAPEHLSRLFDRFYRADSSRRRASDGVGLGLAITRSILRAHGGDASVRSAHGLTVFELNIPA